MQPVIVRKLPARAGLKWLREGLALFRKQPFAFTSIVILYTTAMALVSLVPYIGLPIALMLIPFGTIGITLAGREAERGAIPMPTLLLAPFRDPEQRKGLSYLGFINAALMLLLLTLTSVLAADDMANWKMLNGEIDKVSASENFPWDALLVSGIAYVPILMVTWFAPQLVAWHAQPLGKALFFSFFACWRNRWPFLTLGAALFGITFATVFISSQLLQAIGVSPQLMQMLFAPVVLILISIGYATQYPIYRSLIEADGAAEGTLPR